MHNGSAVALPHPPLLPQAHLVLQGLSAGYGAFLVLRELSLEVRPGLTVILGPNGAGKTTDRKSVV